MSALVAFLAGCRRRGRRVAQRAPASADGPLLDDGPTPTRDQLHAMLANLSEAVTVTDRDRRMRYANHAAAELLGCATPEELLALPLATIAAQWESTHEDGRPMVAEDVPSYKIVNGQPAEPLLTRIVNRETGEQRWRLVKAAPLRGPAGELMAISVIEDVTEAKEAELRQRFLAQAGVTLASSLDYEETLQRVAQLAVPGLADWCAVDVVDAGRRLQQVAVAHVDPDKIAFAREFRSRYPPDPNDDSGIYGVLRSGRPELYPDIPAELLEQSIADPEQLQSILALGMRSVMLIPMVVAGRTIGVLTMVSAESGRAFDEDDLAFAGDLARRAATAVENARLYTERAQAALTLQESLLPARLPNVAGWQLRVLLRGRRHDRRRGRRLLRRRRARVGLPGRCRRRHRQGRAGRGADRAGALHAGHRRALRPEPRRGRAACSTTCSCIAPEISLLTVACAYVEPSASGARMRLTSAGHPPPVLSRPGTRRRPSGRPGCCSA